MVEEIILYYDARSKEHQITLEEVTANELRICTPTQNYDFMGQHYSWLANIFQVVKKKVHILRNESSNYFLR